MPVPSTFEYESDPKMDQPNASTLSPQARRQIEQFDPFVDGEEGLSAEAREFIARQDEWEVYAEAWKQQDQVTKETQWRYHYADKMLAARGERGRMDDIIQAAQIILPALLQSHALRQPEDPGAEDLVGEGFELGWGAPGADVTFIDDHAGERASIAENLAFDAYLLAEAFVEVRRRRYGV